MLLKEKETLDNFSVLYEEYQKAYDIHQKSVNNLYSEIKKIKKLKV